jgi:hypothetical protein
VAVRVVVSATTPFVGFSRNSAKEFLK